MAGLFRVILLLDAGSDSALFISPMASFSIVILEVFRQCIKVTFCI